MAFRGQNVINNLLNYFVKNSFTFTPHQSMIWHIIKYWASFFIPTFYRRIQGQNTRNLQVDGPVIIAMNHPNAFTDPIAITYVSYPLRVHYMARGDAFKPGMVAWLLEKIGIVPIFRMQDAGKEGLMRNDESYRRVNELLKRNAKIIVFAEGICIQERRLRPLKKGVARMVFGAYEYLKNDKLRVVPVGVNYSHPSEFRSNVFYNVGEPIFVKDFVAAYAESPARAQKLFLSTLEPALKKLVTHIQDPKNDQIVYMVEELCKEDQLRKEGLNKNNLSHDFRVLTMLTEKVNVAARTNPALLEEFRQQATQYFDRLKESGLKDRYLNPARFERLGWWLIIIRAGLLLAGSPFYVTGLLGNFLPLFITYRLTKRLVKTKEFFSSFAIGFGMVIFPLTYVGWLILVNWISGSILMAWSACAVMALCGAFALWYHPFLINTAYMIRTLKNRQNVRRLQESRNELISIINKF
jgi:glycerol-3-phosphate O-acyltransferase / dihydroxyacetone phosphate acyltransferase